MSDLNLDKIKQKLAIVILAYADYESLELALASHARFTVESGVKIYVLQNGRGTYDCERTYEVARRYHFLYPDTIFVVDNIKPGIPFHSLKTLFDSKEFKQYDYIIKLDDDVMVLTPDWVDQLCNCFITGKQQYGKDFAYATTLVNNNPYGFKTIIDHSPSLAKEYYSEIARKHYVGPGFDIGAFAPHRIVPKNEIYAGANGTIWGYPYIARWLHEQTTLRPQWYIDFASKLEYDLINNKERYSINCIMFEKTLWTRQLSAVEPRSTDDEHLLHAYCLKYDKKILANLAIPMVHLFFFSQRNENRDLIDRIRAYYTEFLHLPFPISICDNRLIELENRLRFMERQYMNPSSRVSSNRNLISGGIKCIRENGLGYTLKYIPSRLMKGRS